MRKCRSPLPRQEATHLDNKHFYMLKWKLQITGTFPRDQVWHLVKCSKNHIYMPLGCHLLSAVRGPGEAPGHHFTDRDDGEEGWGSQRAWDRAMPARTLCPHCPPVPTLRPSDPEHLGCRFWGLGLAIKFTASSASQERGGRCRRRGFQKSRMTDCAGRRQESETSGEGQRHGKPKGTVFKSSLITPSSPQRDLCL